MASFRKHDIFISFDLVLKNQRGLGHLQTIVDAINEEHDVSSNIKQEAALKLIVLNAIYYNYKPLIISLNNNSNRAESRYNHSGVGITAFKSVYRKLEDRRLVHTRYAAYPSPNAAQSTVITVTGLKRYCLPHEGQIKEYLKQKTELIILRKTVKANGKKSKFLCEYKDTDFSHAARKFLKEYNSWIAKPTITFDMELANATGLFRKPRYAHYSRDEILSYIFTYFYNRSLRRIFSAPDDYSPNQPQALPKLGGRFYGSFWQDAMPRDFRKYLEIDGESSVELDFRAMNVTMLYLQKLGHAWEAYPYENIPLPGNRTGNFPKAVVKPFFTWCLNVKNRKAATALLGDKLADELAANDETAQYAHFLQDNGISYKNYIDAMLEGQPAISDLFFTGEMLGTKLQFHDSEITSAILKQCKERNIYCFPIHDAVLVKLRHKDEIKELMVRTLCDYFEANFRQEYIGLLVKEEHIEI